MRESGASIMIYEVLLLVSLCSMVCHGAFLTRKAAITEPYTLLSTYVRQSPEALEAPSQVYSAEGVLDMTLRVRAATLTVSDMFTYTSRVYCVNEICSSPGPSIFTRQGDEVRITVVNELDVGTANITNLYIRGLHLERTSTESPAGLVSSSNVYPANSLRGIKGSAEGDNSATYSFTIPSDHAPGMQWYHSNVADDTHGDSGGSVAGTAALHMMSGLVGAFHVLPVDDQVLPGKMRTMSSVEMIMTHLMLDKNSRDVTQIAAIADAPDTSFTRSWSLAELESSAGGTLDNNISYLPGSEFSLANDSASNTSTRLLRDVWLINGQYQPSVEVQPGDWKIFNILAASGDRQLELEIRDEVGATAGNRKCQMWLYAIDGVYLNQPRHADNTNHLVLLPGSRASVGVHCYDRGIFYLQSTSSMDLKSDYASVGTYDTKSAQVLAVLNVTGAFVWYQQGGLNVSLDSIGRPTYLRTLFNLSDASLTADQASWSLSTEAAGADGSGLGSAHIGGSLGNYNQLGDNTSSYWLGTGTDCTLPCFSNKDCVAFFGAQYTAENFFTSKKGYCIYGNGRSSISSEDPSANGPFSYTKGSAVDLRIWGRQPRAYPLSFPEHKVQLASYTAAVAGPASITATFTSTSASLTSNTNNTILSLYGEPGDWRDTVPALPGLLTVRTMLHLPPQQPAELVGIDEGKSTVHCNYLKFEDHGMIERFLIDSSNITYSPVVTTSATVGGDSGDNSSTATRSTTVYDADAAELRANATDGFLDKDAFDSVYQMSPSPRSLDNTSYDERCDTHGDSWAYSERIDTDRQVRVLTFNGCPNHFSVCQDKECGGPNMTRALKHPDVITVPLYPSFRTVRRDATCTREAIGVALNGVPIHGKADSSGTNVCRRKTGANATVSPHDVFTSCDLENTYDGVLYCGDEIPEQAAIMDKCAGYANNYGSYRYLVAPACLLNQLIAQREKSASAVGDTVDIYGNALQYNRSIIGTALGATTASPSPQVGWALDGFPIYGPVGPSGITMIPCGNEGAHPTVCLDVCNGYKGEVEQDAFMYRYYMSGERGTGACSNVTANANPSTYAYTSCPRLEDQCCLSSAPNPSFAPYSIGCFVGCKYNETSCRYTGERGVTPEYSPIVDLPSVPSSVYLASPEEEEEVAATLSGGPVAASPLTTVQQQQAALASLYYTQQERQRVRNFTRPKNVVHLPFSNALALVETPLSAVNATNSATDDDSITLETLASADTDMIISSLVVDQDGGESGHLYFAAAHGLYSLVDGLHAGLTNRTALVDGYLKVSITGLNFGTSRKSVTSLKVGRTECDSIVWFSSTSITCVLTGGARGGSTTASSYTEADVSLTIANAGTANGVYLEPMTVFKSGSGRPAISSVAFTERPFRPMTLSYLSRPVPVSVATEQIATYSTTTTKTTSCEPFNGYNTDGNRQNYTICEIEACGGDTVVASLCADDTGASCKGDTLLSLHDTYYPVCDGVHNCEAYTYNHSLVMENDNHCGLCSQVTYRVPVVDGNPTCSTFYLRQGCNTNEQCNGTTIVSVQHTEWTKVAPLTIDDHENGTRRTLYWSDAAPGGYGIFRCWLHVTMDNSTNWCSQTELVATNVQRARGLQTIAVACNVSADGSIGVEEESSATNQCDLVLYADATTGALYRLLLPALVPDTVYDADSSAAMYPSTGDYVGSEVQLVSGIRGPVGLAVDRDYISSNVDKAANARLFVTLLEGKLLRFDMSDILGPTAGFPRHVDVATFGYNEYSALGAVTVLDAPSKARFGGLSVVPPLSISDGETSVASWRQPRVFVVDSNQNFLYAATEWRSGARPDITLDVNSAYDTPSAILMPVSIAARTSSATATSVDLYIAEYLGKIWKVTVLLDDTSGEVKSTEFSQTAPEIVLDESLFTASVKIRAEAEVAKALGVPIYERVFFDALQ